MTAAAVVIAALAGGMIGWWFGRRGPHPSAGTAVAPHLLPDPALDWLRRAHGALGVWVAELDPAEEGPRAERIVDAERLSVAQIVAVDRRLERARDGEESGTERLDGGTLVFQAAAGTVVGMLLPNTAAADGLGRAGDDLRRLLEGVRRRPQVVALAQAGTQEASFESLASIGLRLAYQVERILVAHGLGAEVAVAAVDVTGVRIVGVSGRTDRRLFDSVVPADGELARLIYDVSGAGRADVLANGVAVLTDTLRGAIADRRQRVSRAFAFPMQLGNRPVGALVVWVTNGQELTPAARAELHEALGNAAPRLVAAGAAERESRGGRVDPLTGLCDRRGFEELLGQAELQRGVVIVLDLDRFKLLNDTLGHAAGDAALVHVARLIREQVRSEDVAARIGGEAFALWLPGANGELGGKVAERIRIRIGTTPWDWQGRGWPLSASFGVALHSGGGQSAQAVMDQADTALLVAKQSGRNRVEKAG